MGRRTLGIIVAACVIAAAGGLWLAPRLRPPKGAASGVAGSAAAAAQAPVANKIIVGDQAQKNLGLTAKPLQAEVFWKSITIQGMIVDRPGMSDREIVAPAVGAVSKLYRVPGDMVEPGDKLLELTLASESLQQAQTDYFQAHQNIQLAEARRERLGCGVSGVPEARII